MVKGRGVEIAGPKTSTPIRRERIIPPRLSDRGSRAKGGCHMTDGHKHRVVRVRRGGIVERALRGTTIARSTDLPYVMRSRFTWGADSTAGPYRLTPLGLLHGLCGLTLEVND